MDSFKISKISENIASLRKNRGFTQDELASAVGVSAQAVSKWECGGLPDIALIPAIAEFLGVSSDKIFGLSEKSDFNEVKETSFTQKICDEIYNNADFSTDNPEKYFDFIREVIFTSHKVFFKTDSASKSAQSFKNEIKNFGISEISKEKQKTAVTSELLFNEGITVLSMNENFPMAFIMKQPQDPSVFEITDDMKTLFNILGSDEGSKLFFNLFSNKSNKLKRLSGNWSVKKFAELMEISEEFLIKNLDFLNKCQIISVKDITMDNETHKIISYNQYAETHTAGLITMAAMLTRFQRWYCCYCNNRGRPMLG